jgi:hypothetical protein
VTQPQQTYVPEQQQHQARQYQPQQQQQVSVHIFNNKSNEKCK